MCGTHCRRTKYFTNTEVRTCTECEFVWNRNHDIRSGEYDWLILFAFVYSITCLMRCYCSIVVVMGVIARDVAECVRQNMILNRIIRYTRFGIYGEPGTSHLQILFSKPTGGCLLVPIHLQNYGVTQLTPVSSWSTHQLNQINFIYKRIMATRLSFENSNEIGVFCALTNAYCLTGALLHYHEKNVFFTRNCITTNFSLLFLLNFSIK